MNKNITDLCAASGFAILQSPIWRTQGEKFLQLLIKDIERIVIDNKYGSVPHGYVMPIQPEELVDLIKQHVLANDTPDE